MMCPWFDTFCFLFFSVVDELGFLDGRHCRYPLSFLCTEPSTVRNWNADKPLMLQLFPRAS